MTVIVNSAKLQQLVTEIYLALGLSDAQAERLSDSLVAADLWGIPHTGFAHKLVW